MSILQTPGSDGRFGEFGGRFVPETLVPACQELEGAFNDAWNDPLFRADLDQLLREYAGRPSILTECHNLSEQLRILLVQCLTFSEGVGGICMGHKAFQSSLKMARTGLASALMNFRGRAISS